MAGGSTTIGINTPVASMSPTGEGWLIQPSAQKEQVLKEGDNKMKIKVKAAKYHLA